MGGFQAQEIKDLPDRFFSDRLLASQPLSQLKLKTSNVWLDSKLQTVDNVASVTCRIGVLIAAS